MEDATVGGGCRTGNEIKPSSDGESMQSQSDSLAKALGVGAAFVLCVSACIITIQCCSVRFLPTLSLVASSSTITGVFITAIAVYAVIVGSMLFPSLAVVQLNGAAKARGDVAWKYSGSLAGILVLVNGLFWLYVAALGKWKDRTDVLEWLTWIFFAAVFLLTYRFAYRLFVIHGKSFAPNGDQVVEAMGRMQRLKAMARRLLAHPLLVSILYLVPASFAVVPLILALAITQPESVNLMNAGLGMVLCILIAAVNWVALERPKPFARNAAIAAVVFAVFWASWLTPAVFRLLGLGNRTFQIAVVDYKFRDVLEQGGFSVSATAGTSKGSDEGLLVKNGWLSLRLGDEILIAKSPADAAAGRSLILQRSAVFALILEDVNHKFESPDKK
jgi:hypothetical protein